MGRRRIYVGVVLGCVRRGRVIYGGKPMGRPPVSHHVKRGRRR